MRTGIINNHFLAAIAAIGSLVVWHPCNAQTVPTWQNDALKSLVRIVSQKCFGPCQKPEEDRWVRTGSGFVTSLPNFDGPVIVTALHLVAGADRITYEFAEVEAKRVEADLIATDRYNDVAILALDNAAGRLPLELTTSLPQSNQVIVYGYKQGAQFAMSDQGRLKLRGPTALRQVPIGENAINAIAKLGYPDLDMTIVPLEEAVNPGDSGAPVFDYEGRVVGMAEGGLPSSAAQLSWMVPSSSLLGIAAKGAATEANYDAAGSADFFDAFYTFSEKRSVTKIGLRPSVKFTLGWRADFEPLSSYQIRVNALVSPDYKVLDKFPKGVLGSSIFPRDSEFFPRPTEGIYPLLTSASLQIICYRAQVFDKILLQGSRDLPQSDIYLKVPISDFKDAEGGVSLSYDWNGPGPSLVIISSNGLVSYKPGYGRYARHPDINNIEDLYGGACNVSVVGKDYELSSDQTQRLTKELRFGAVCLDIFFTDQSYTPVSFASYLPLGKELSDGEIWGFIPSIETNGTVDQQSCM
ncbi:serine protease [Rhizobium leguminosarum]|uniref:S1 family peptidase n=1 Tax=Rhizobium leguminosarum TaxID=384 RepID=UPI003F94A4A1